jgi:outer membrane lipoprotein-sorting protein
MTKTGKELVLWDIPNGTRKIRRVDTAVTETTPLIDDSVASIERKMSGSLGLLPFYDISKIPPGAEWSQVTDEALKTAERDTEVYDLTWVRKQYGGSDRFLKLRVSVDSRTKLPQRTKFYEKLPAGTTYDLTSVKKVEYLSDSEIQSVIKEVGF